MKIIVAGRNNFKVTPALRDYVTHKFEKFERYLADITEAAVTLSAEKYRQRAEVLIRANGVSIQAAGITGEIYSSIDEVVEKTERQIKKHKEKLTSRRKAELKSKAVRLRATVSEDSGGRIIRRKSMDSKPMAPDEAAMQMELLGKDLFFFTNDQTGDINVLTRRKDGNFDLVEPVK